MCRASCVGVGLLILVFAGCGNGTETAREGVLATYRGGEITQKELDAHLTQQAAAQQPLPELDGDWRVAVLQEMALREIVVAKASEIDTPELTEQVESAREGIYIRTMIDRLGWNNLSVSEADVREYYDQNPDIFVDPEKLRLQHIFIRSERSTASPAERAEARERLEAIRRQILDGADFAAMAKEHSDSADGPAGGWMLLKAGARAVPEFTEAVWELEPDEVTEVIDTPAGFQLARLAARIPAVIREFEDVRQFATQEKLKTERRRVEEEYLAAKGPEHGLVIHHELLADPTVEDDDVLFALDGEEMTVGEFLAVVPDKYRPHFFAGYMEYLPRILEQAALDRLLLREAIEAGVPDDPAVQAEVAATEQQLRTSAEIDRRLVERSKEVSEQELRDHYEQNQDRFETVRRRTVSIIRLPPEKGVSLWTLLKKGERLADEIRAGADFAEMARKHSQHVSAQDGGVLLTQTDDELRLRIQGRNRGLRVINALEVGEISKAFIGEVYDPHRLRYVPSGVYIVRLDEDLEPRQAPFEEVEELVRANYLRRYYTRFLSELREEMLAESDFDVVEANLPALGA